MVIHANFLTHPIKLYDVLPVKEQKVVSKLLDMKADEYLTWPLKENEELVIQTLHLVSPMRTVSSGGSICRIASAVNWIAASKPSSCGC